MAGNSKKTAIWSRRPDIQQLTQRAQGTLGQTLGIEILEIGDDYLRARMPVDSRTVQPFGILHGGASAALIETLASVGGNFVVREDQHCVGLELNCNHLRPVKSGWVEGVARPLHIGSRTQVWDVTLSHQGKTTCVGRMTLMVLNRES